MQKLDHVMFREYVYALEDINTAQHMVEMASEAVHDGEPLSDESRALIDIAVRTVEPIVSTKSPVMVADDSVALEGIGDWLKKIKTKLSSSFKDRVTSYKNKRDNKANDFDSMSKRVTEARKRLSDMEDFKGGVVVSLHESKARGGVISGSLSSDVLKDTGVVTKLLSDYNETIVEPAYKMLNAVLLHAVRNIDDVSKITGKLAPIINKYGDHNKHLQKLLGGKDTLSVVNDSVIQFNNNTAINSCKALASLFDISDTNSTLVVERANSKIPQVVSYDKETCLRYLDGIDQNIGVATGAYDEIWLVAYDAVRDAFNVMENRTFVDLEDEDHEFITLVLRIMQAPWTMTEVVDDLYEVIYKANDHMLSVIEQSIIAHK